VLGGSDEFSEPWNLRSRQDVHCWSMVFSYWSHRLNWSSHMNIFYIIGVVVVIVVIAGFFGLHA
jgi:hypothetical protein